MSKLFNSLQNDTARFVLFMLAIMGFSEAIFGIEFKDSVIGTFEKMSWLVAGALFNNLIKDKKEK